MADTWRVEQREGDEGPWDLLGSAEFGYATGLGVDEAHDVARTVRSRGFRARIVLDSDRPEMRVE